MTRTGSILPNLGWWGYSACRALAAQGCCLLVLRPRPHRMHRFPRPAMWVMGAGSNPAGRGVVGVTLPVGPP